MANKNLAPDEVQSNAVVAERKTFSSASSSLQSSSCSLNVYDVADAVFKQTAAITGTDIDTTCNTANSSTLNGNIATNNIDTTSISTATADTNDSNSISGIDSASAIGSGVAAIKANTPISDFYRNATVLITGGTGFVGKVLIHKLLYAFQLRKIYMLIRCKDSMNVEQRLQQFFNESIFDRIRSERPELFERVHPIRADFNANDLAISQADRQLLRQEVEIVFNVVASVKFNEKLSDAISINVLGTKKILDLAMEITHLKSFVHISTLYCNCNRAFIKEQVYENEIGYEKIMQIYRICDDETLEKMRHCLIGEMPNTYTMTKKCAENLVNHRAFFLPAGIFRPPIVMSTYKEPFPGWTDNLYGPSGLCAWSARGLVRCIYGDAKCKANMVPVDYCVNAIIASAWDIQRRYSQQKLATDMKIEIPVYNYIFDKNNITWGQYMRLAYEGYHEPFDKALWCFSYIIIPSKPIHTAIAFFLHRIPAYILDLIAMATGQKRIYIKAYSKISRIIYMMSWFGLKHWKFTHNNIDELDALLVGAERQLLQFNIATINWSDYFRTYLSGIRKYFFKDNDNKLQKRKAIYRRMVIANNFLKTTFGFSLIMLLLKIYLKLSKRIPKLALSN